MEAMVTVLLAANRKLLGIMTHTYQMTYIIAKDSSSLFVDT